MKPVNFKEANVKYIARGCGDLPTYKDDKQIISCWQLSLRERFKLIFSKRVWLIILGLQQPPVCIVADKPFNKER